MKKFTFLLILPIIFASCGDETAPPDEVGQFPPDYVISAGDDLPSSIESDEANVDENGDLIADENGLDDGRLLSDEDDTELLICREENADVSLELDAANRQLEICQLELAEKEQQAVLTPAAASISNEHLELIKTAVLAEEQVEYPFRNCGQMGNFITQAWFQQFTDSLLQKRIRFANGFLEVEDLFGGCQSTEGKMAFFLGAERNDTLEFLILKYNLETQELTPALMLDNAATAAVTAFGRREGSFVNFPSDDGRTFRYYYDSNIVVEAP
jgi:hypothetical protein